jgi:uncharacterized protein (DUF433 family)
MAFSEANDVGPGIRKTPGVCGGSARIREMRIPVWLLEGFRRDGVSDMDLLKAYPSLTAHGLANAWAYVEGHAEEIESDLRENDDDSTDE